MRLSSLDHVQSVGMCKERLVCSKGRGCRPTGTDKSTNEKTITLW